MTPFHIPRIAATPFFCGIAHIKKYLVSYKTYNKVKHLQHLVLHTYTKYTMFDHERYKGKIN